MSNLKIRQVSVAFSPVEQKIVERVSKKHGLNNFSSALRMIVREWDEANRGNGHTKPASSTTVAEVNKEEKQ